MGFNTLYKKAMHTIAVLHFLGMNANLVSLQTHYSFSLREKKKLSTVIYGHNYMLRFKILCKPSC